MCLTQLEVVAACITGLGTFALAVLTWFVYIQQRPQIKLEITDSNGNKNPLFYYTFTTTSVGKALEILICFRITIIQYASTSILSNMALAIRGIPQAKGLLRITRLIPKDPFALPYDYRRLLRFIQESEKRNLLSDRMYDFELKGCGIYNVVAMTITDDIWSETGLIPGPCSFSLTIGVKKFGPFILNPFRLEDQPNKSSAENAGGPDGARARN